MPIPTKNLLSHGFSKPRFPPFQVEYPGMRPQPVFCPGWGRGLAALPSTAAFAALVVCVEGVLGVAVFKHLERHRACAGHLSALVI